MPPDGLAGWSFVADPETPPSGVPPETGRLYILRSAFFRLRTAPGTPFPQESVAKLPRGRAPRKLQPQMPLRLSQSSSPTGLLS